MEGGPGDVTVWNGSAFDCSGSKIALIHDHFESRAGECNRGSIVAHGISVQGNCYTSQLTIRNVTHDMIGRTITCVHYNLSAEFIVVGTLTIATVGEVH